MKEGKLIIIAGQKGSGKTTKSMELIADKKQVLCYDFLNNYTELIYWRDGTKIQKPGLKLIKGMSELQDSFKSKSHALRFAPPFWDVYKFMAILDATKGFTILLEEATGLFPNNKIPQELILQAQATRHTGNVFIFVFHALHRVPPQLFEFMDEVYLFKTGDMERNIKSKFPKLLNTGKFAYINGHPDPHYFELLYKNDIL